MEHQKNDRTEFIKALLQETTEVRWSLEISPSSEFGYEVFQEISPLFVAVTWLGNVNLEKPISDIACIALAKKLTQCNFPVLLHMCGRNIPRRKMVEILDYLKGCNVRNLLALQGDWPHVLETDDTKCDFPYASDLVLFIKTHYPDDFSVGVAGYPDCHPHSRSLDEDLKYLKLKVSNGADFIITQASFDYDCLEAFADNCKKHDIIVPIVPGFLIIKSYKSLMDMTAHCNLKVSEKVICDLENSKNDDKASEKYIVDLVADLIVKCKRKPNYFSAVHIFSMNDIVQVQKVLSKVKFD